MPARNIMQTINAVRLATLRAREAAKMDSIGTRANMGRFQVINTTFGPRGTATIEPLTDYLSPEAACAALDQIAEDKGFRA